jgi:hypothetical protein
MTIRAIETNYNGYRFRSRLEARWAVFYDALGIPYEYEKEGFDLGDGLFYLPDFWLPEQRLWVEIKPEPPTGEESRKWETFAEKLAMAETVNEKAVMFIGNIPNPETVDYNGPSGKGDWYDGAVVFGDSWYAWCACRSGRHFDVQFEARGDRIDCGCPGFVQGGRGGSGNHPALLKAYGAARSARFEHGDKPSVLA